MIKAGFTPPCNFPDRIRYNAPPMDARKRIGVFGWGVVAPKSPNIDAFERNLERADSWLSPFRGFGPSNFLVGYPEFDFETYHDWFDQRFPPAKFKQLKDKMGPMVLSCIGAFIQSLTQNPGIEEYLQSLGTQAHVYIGTGLGEITDHRDRDDRLRPRAAQVERILGRARALRRVARAHRRRSTIPPRRAIPTNSPIGCEDWIDAKHAWEEFWAREERRAPSLPRRSGRHPIRAGAAVVRIGEAQHDPPETEQSPRAEQKVGLPRRAVGRASRRTCSGTSPTSRPRRCR